MKEKMTLWLAIIIVVFFAALAGFPLLHKGLPPTHDGEYHIVRFYEFDKVLREGNWYPRWAPDFNQGFGIPIFNYVYPLPNYIASLFHFFGTSFIDAFKFQMFLAVIIGGVFFYLWSREFWGNLGGIVSSVFYTFSPYHFLDIYIRGSVGEVWSLTFFPALLWSLTRFIRYERKIFFLLSSVFLALIIFSHNILALMFFSFAIIYAGFLITNSENRRYLAVNTLCIMLFGLGLSSVFWLPALFEKQYVVGLQIFDISAHFPQLYQLLIPSWGSGFSGASIQNQMSFQIGIANLLAVFISFSIVILTRHRKDKNLRIIVLFLISFLLVFFFMIRQSLFIWNSIPFVSYFQFPWRFLSLEIIIAPFLAGSIVYFWKSKVLTAILMLLVFFLGVGYMKPAFYHQRDDNHYLTRSNFMDGTNSPGNAFNTIWFNSNLQKQKNKITFENNLGKVKTQFLTSTQYKFNVVLNEATEATINTAYFPGWKVFIDSKETQISYDKDGLITFPISQGKHSILVTFQETIVRKLANIVAIISLLWLIGR